MSAGIQLISLRCTKCSQPLSGDNQSLLLYCSACGSGFEIVRKQELISTPVYFAKKDKAGSAFLPFWAFDSTLQLAERKGKGGFFSRPEGLAHMFEKNQTIRFYVAAFKKDLGSKNPIGLNLTYEQPDLEYLHPQEKFPSVEISQEDAKKIADYQLISSEIEQKDTLRTLEYQLTLQNPMLIAIAL